MLIPGGQFRIFLAPRPIDMRFGIDRLAHLCQSELEMNPHGGAVFLFFNRSRNRAKIYFFDGSGSCLFLKRLERGRFKVPSALVGARTISIPANELGLLLEGVDVAKIQRPKKWVPRLPPKEVDLSGLAPTSKI